MPDSVDNLAGAGEASPANAAWSIRRAISRARPSPTTCAAAGSESSAISRLTIVSPATFGGVTTSSCRVGSLGVISAPSATQLAAGSAVTSGIRYFVDEVVTTVATARTPTRRSRAV